MNDVTLLLGRAGAGKSQTICNAIADELHKSPIGPPVYWVVPGDASYATERRLLSAVGGTLRTEVVTLQRLAERADRELHYQTGGRLDSTGKRLLLASVYEACRGDLQVLRRDRVSMSFLDAILNVFTEFADGAISLADIDAAMESAATATSLLQPTNGAALWARRSLFGKLRDVCLLYRHWKQAVEEKEFFDPDELLTALAPRLSLWPDLASAAVYIDGFADMTPAELEFVLAVAQVAKHTVVALSMEPSWVSAQGDVDGGTWMDDVYAPQTLALYRRIQEGCASRRLAVKEIHLSGDPGQHRFSASPSLAVLERGIFGTPVTNSPVPSDIHLRVARNVRAESEGVAMEVARLVRTESLAFGDIVVLVPDLHAYSSDLQRSFERYNLPVYVDVFPSLSTHPLARFLLSLLDSVEQDLSTVSVAKLLRSDFVGIPQEDADWFETYLTVNEIEGHEAWVQADPWRFAQRSAQDHRAVERAVAEDLRADSLRRKLSQCLGPLYHALHTAEISPWNLCDALWTSLQCVNAKRMVTRWAMNDDGQETPMEASMHEQAWQKIISILDNLYRCGIDGKLPRGFLFELVRADLVRGTLSTIPASVNQVVVTEIVRASGQEARAVFILGVSDGVFPRRIQPSGLLQDEEREQFQLLFGTKMGYSTAERQSFERLTVYTALTRAAHRLYMSYPLAGSDGKEIRPAVMLNRIRDLFGTAHLQEGLWGERVDEQDDLPSWVMSEDTALDWLLAAMRQTPPHTGPSEGIRQLQRWFQMDPDRRVKWERVAPSLAHRARSEALEPALARELYGNPMHTNVYQLETFAACPYRHFVQYGLKVRLDEPPDVTAALRGTLLHDVLLAFVRWQMEDWAAAQSVTDAAAVERMRQLFRATLQAPASAIWLRKLARTEQAGEVQRVLENAALMLTRHARHGLFAPKALELSFGLDEPGSLPEFEVALGDDLSIWLRGRIDRVDAAIVAGKPMFRIVDYKSSVMDLDLTKIAHGLRLQLPVYAAVVERLGQGLLQSGGQPVGMLYIPVTYRVEMKNSPDDEAHAGAEVLKGMRAKGWMLEDTDVIAGMDQRVAAGQASDLFAKIFNKDGSITKGAPVLSEQEWNLLRGRVLRQVEDLARRTLAGETRVSPYRLGLADTACTFCPYGAVCHVDPRWDADVFRKLDKFQRDRISEEWGETTDEEACR